MYEIVRQCPPTYGTVLGQALLPLQRKRGVGERHGTGGVRRRMEGGYGRLSPFENVEPPANGVGSPPETDLLLARVYREVVAIPGTRPNVPRAQAGTSPDSYSPGARHERTWTGQELARRA